MDYIVVPDSTYAQHRELINALAAKITAQDELGWFVRIEGTPVALDAIQSAIEGP